MTPITVTNPDKRLSGGARGLLNDLALLNEKTSQEMARGIAESYLDPEGAKALALELGVEPPKTKQRFYRYFTQTQVYSIAIDAYDEEQADAEAARMANVNVSQRDIHYGNRSRFNQSSGAISRVFSQMTRERPTVGAVPNIHPWEVERAEAEAAGRRWRDYGSQISWNTVIS